MDDNTQQATPAVNAPAADTTMSSMSDVAGMTPPPPAPVMPTDMPAAPAMPEPAMPEASEPAVNAPAAGEEGQEDYSYAEDVLNEILDSLDRIEAKLEAMEKKG